eukprot:CAMPEP_0171117932 /NCGR_PEP_ID=MMETSP0766_2-20121228/93610_1 /TAXON_ID=439317 /ORGANISM="Gambierdiscus australes, Strain CAWD 149" /LENGTH=169 /DNA_ID=CAMNT_0011580479 /DNA_START=152 /DNA_END=658 /DNA_ORIENTATION=-
MALALEFVEVAAASADAVLAALEQFAESQQTWLKVAGGPKAEVLSCLLRQHILLSTELAAEYGCFLGYTTVRIAGLVDRVASLELDAVHVCCAQHVLDLARVRAAAEVWFGHVPWLTPRFSEEFGAAALGFAFMDHKGTRFHLDADDVLRHELAARDARVLADNTLNPG